MGWAEESHWDDPDERFWDPGSEPRVTRIQCKYCGMTGLHWVEVEELSKGVLVRKRWKLYDVKENLHMCQRGLKKT